MTMIIVLVGLPGSGKSTYANNVVEDPEIGDTFFTYSTDNYIELVATENHSTYSEVFEETIAEATKQMNETLEYALTERICVIWDQTNMSPKKRRSILSRIPADYRKVCVCIVPPRNDQEWADLFARLESRKGKHIPEYVVRNMAASYKEPSLIEGFDAVFLQDMYGKKIYSTAIEQETHNV